MTNVSSRMRSALRSSRPSTRLAGRSRVRELHARRRRQACNLPEGETVPGTLDVLIQFVCDAHVSRDPIGPFVTRHEGAWAYCAGHGATGHRWRRITAI